MQFSTADATLPKKNNHKKIKTMPSEVAYFNTQSEIFSTANRPKTSPNLIFCFIKMTHRATYNDDFAAYNMYAFSTLARSAVRNTANDALKRRRKV